MKNYFYTIYLYAKTLLTRTLRDPLTLLILFGIPVVLLLVFGYFLGGNQNINIRTAILNNSEQAFAREFKKALDKVDVLEVSEDKLELNEARELVRDGELDTIILLPANFGRINDQGVPTGEVITYTSQTNSQSTQLVSSVISAITEEFNRELVGVEMPLNITERSVDSADAKAIHHIFPIFTALGLLMVGAFGISSLMPADRKAHILRRLKITPLRKSQVVLGTGITFVILGLGLAALMVGLAVFLFDMNMSAETALTLAAFLLIGLISMIGLGLAVGSWAKNPTQGEGAAQVIFLASMGLSGIWVPVAMMPEFLQNIVVFMPLTPVVDGMRFILVEHRTLIGLLPQLAVIASWTVITYLASFKLFRWE